MKEKTILRIIINTFHKKTLSYTYISWYILLYGIYALLNTHTHMSLLSVPAAIRPQQLPEPRVLVCVLPLLRVQRARPAAQPVRVAAALAASLPFQDTESRELTAARGATPAAVATTATTQRCRHQPRRASTSSELASGQLAQCERDVRWMCCTYSCDGRAGDGSTWNMWFVLGARDPCDICLSSFMRILTVILRYWTMQFIDTDDRVRLCMRTGVQFKLNHIHTTIDITR